MSNNNQKISPVLSPKLLEILSHPLRQKILIIIEREGYIGYKDLKEECKVAIGTLYHHLRILKELIGQNSDKKYILRPDGKKALDFIFQDVRINIPDKELNNSKIKKNNIKNPLLETLYYLPNMLYNLLFLIYIPLILILYFTSPNVVFLHFIPVASSTIMGPILIIILTSLAILYLYGISLYCKKKLTYSSWSIIIGYFDIIIVLSVLVNLVSFLNNILILTVISLLIQGGFIFTWTSIVSMEFWSWEKSLISGIIPNYILLLIL